MSTPGPTQVQRDRAARGGRLAAKSGKSVARCPYDANGTPHQRQLAVVFVRAYFEAGGTLDGIDFGDGKRPAPARSTPSTRTSGPAAGGRRRGKPYGHLGYLQ